MNLKDLIKAAKSKDKDAMYILATLYLKGNMGVNRDIEEAYRLFEQSAKMGKVDSLHQLAKIHLTEEYNKFDSSKAIKLFLQSSKRGNSESCYELGVIYLRGKITNPDVEKAEELLRQAAVNKNKPIVEAQILVANIYENSLISGYRDLGESFRFYKMAAEKGNSEAQFKVGKYLINGLDGSIDTNIEEGMSYLKQASLAGYSSASLYLSKIYIEEAKKLLDIASKKDIDAKYVLDPLNKINTELLDV